MEFIHIKVGQIWMECDPRINRFVEILQIRQSCALIRTVTKDGAPVKGSKSTEALKTRFNGRRGGYKLFKDISP